MKIDLSITRRELSEEAYGDAAKVVKGEAKPLPDEARLIAEVIYKIFISKEGNLNASQHT